MSENPQQNLSIYFDKLMSHENSKVPDNIKFTIPLMKNTDLRFIIGSLDVAIRIPHFEKNVVYRNFVFGDDTSGSMHGVGPFDLKLEQFKQ